MSEKHFKIYWILRSFLYLIAFSTGIFLLLSIVFPSSYFTFNFENPRAAKNTLANPRNEAGKSLEKGEISDGETLIFDAADIGYFSSTKVKLFSKDHPRGSLSGKGRVKKSFQAFLYSEGNPQGFSDGSLVKDEKDNWYFVSAGRLRKFKNKSIFSQMGFPEDNVFRAQENDLRFNASGDTIEDINQYPAGTVFRIEENYFKLSEESELQKFINPEAYLSYGRDFSVEKETSFLKNFSIAEKEVGFASGSLLVYGTSAFIVSNNLILPIGDALIFESKGFKWDDLINIGGDVVSFYEKGKIFELDSPHPNGTVFLTTDTQEYYLVKDNRKYLLPSQIIADSWLKNAPVLVSDKGAQVEYICQLTFSKKFLGKSYYQCLIENVEYLNQYPGTDYEFYLSFDGPAELSEGNVILEKNMNLENLRLFWNNLTSRIKMHYAK